MALPPLPAGYTALPDDDELPPLPAGFTALPDEQPRAPLGFKDRLAGTGRLLAQGASLGFADEAEAAMRAAPGARGPGGNAVMDAITGFLSPGYDKELANVRGNLADMREEFPGRAAVTEFTGAVLPAALTFGATAPASGASLTATGARVVPGVFRQMGRGAVTGATVGGATGFGSSEGDLVDRFNRGTEGAVIGAATGGIIPGALHAGRNLGRWGKNLVTGRLSAREAQDKADDLVLQSLDRDALPLNEAQRKLAEARKSGVGGTILPDVAGPNTVGRLAAAGNTPGEARRVAAEYLTRRSQRQNAGLQADAQRAAGIPRQDTNALLDDLIARQKAASDDAYETAYARGVVDDPAVASFFDPKVNAERARVFQQAREVARELSGLEGNPTGVFAPNSVRALDDVKRGIDALIDRETDAVTGKMTPRGRALVIAKKDYLAALDDAVPEYKAARAVFAGERELQQAVLAGRKALNASTDEWRAIAKDFAGMTAGEKQMVLRGVVDDIGLQLERRAQATGTKTPDLTSVLSSEQTMSRLRTLFPTAKAFDDFKAAVGARGRQQEVKNAVLSGSRTAPLANDMADLAESGVQAGEMGSLAHGNPFPVAIGTLLRASQRRLLGITDDVNARVAEALTLSGPKLDAYLRRLDPKMQQNVIRELRRASGANAGAALGAQQAVIATQPRDRGQ